MIDNMGKSRVNTSAGSCNPSPINPGNANTPNRLKVLEPITVANAISGIPRRTPAIAAASSGKLVPNATIVRPINKSLTPIAFASCTLPQTIICELINNMISMAIVSTNALFWLTSKNSSSFSTSSVDDDLARYTQ